MAGQAVHVALLRCRQLKTVINPHPGCRLGATGNLPVSRESLEHSASVAFSTERPPCSLGDLECRPGNVCWVSYGRQARASMASIYRHPSRSILVDETRQPRVGGSGPSGLRPVNYHCRGRRLPGWLPCAKGNGRKTWGRTSRQDIAGASVAGPFTQNSSYRDRQ